MKNLDPILTLMQIDQLEFKYTSLTYTLEKTTTGTQISHTTNLTVAKLLGKVIRPISPTIGITQPTISVQAVHANNLTPSNVYYATEESALQNIYIQHNDRDVVFVYTTHREPSGNLQATDEASLPIPLQNNPTITKVDLCDIKSFCYVVKKHNTDTFDIQGFYAKDLINEIVFQISDQGTQGLHKITGFLLTLAGYVWPIPQNNPRNKCCSFFREETPGNVIGRIVIETILYL